MAVSAKIINTTTNNYIRTVEQNIVTKRVLLAGLKSKGRITPNCDGQQLDWKVRYKRIPIVGFADFDTSTFPNQNLWKTAQLPYRAYRATDSMTKFQKLQNRGTPAIVKIYSNTIKTLMDDVKEGFSNELYVDGSTAANAKKIHGLETLFSGAGSSAGTAGLPSPYVGYFSSTKTYAGLTMNLGAYGGTWDSSSSATATDHWPNGTATNDMSYDFWHPLIVNYTNSNWEASTDNWANNAIEAMRFMAINLDRHGTAADLFVLEKQLYRQFMAALDERERIMTERNAANSLMLKLGFAYTVNFDGVDVVYEQGVPSGVGYAITFDKTELCSMQDQLFKADEIDFDIAGAADRFSVDFYGNLKLNPRHTGKFVALG